MFLKMNQEKHFLGQLNKILRKAVLEAMSNQTQHLSSGDDLLSGLSFRQFSAAGTICSIVSIFFIIIIITVALIQHFCFLGYSLA